MNRLKVRATYCYNDGNKVKLLVLYYPETRKDNHFVLECRKCARRSVKLLLKMNHLLKLSFTHATLLVTIPVTAVVSAIGSLIMSMMSIITIFLCPLASKKLIDLKPWNSNINITTITKHPREIRSVV